MLIYYVTLLTNVYYSLVSHDPSYYVNKQFQFSPTEITTLFAVISGDVKSKMKAKFVSNSRSALRSICLLFTAKYMCTKGYPYNILFLGRVSPHPTRISDKDG